MTKEQTATIRKLLEAARRLSEAEGDILRTALELVESWAGPAEADKDDERAGLTW